MKKEVVTLATLVLGQVLLVGLRKVEGGKCQLDIAEIIDNPKRSNVLGMLNADDDRFNNIKPKARRTFTTASPAMVEKYFGVKASEIAKLGEDETMDLNILNPTIEGKALRIEIKETHKATPWQAENLAKAAKQFTNSKTEETFYFVKNGKVIFSNPKVVDREPQHDIKEADALLTYEEVEQLPAPFDATVVLNEKAKGLNG